MAHTPHLSSIFQALPLSFIFVMCLSGATNMWYEAATGNHKGVGFATMFTLIAIALLLWVSTIGDEYLNARASLLRPDTSMNLQKVLGRDQAQVFAMSLQRTQLGFDLVNVTVTSHRVLYVIFSLMVAALYMMPKN